jgi:hypothetical protein
MEITNQEKGFAFVQGARGLRGRWKHPLEEVATRECKRTILSPLRGSLTSHILPTACAVGCILAPLRG